MNSLVKEDWRENVDAAFTKQQSLNAETNSNFLREIETRIAGAGPRPLE